MRLVIVATAAGMASTLRRRAREVCGMRVSFRPFYLRCNMKL
jgi:hypothetical protein